MYGDYTYEQYQLQGETCIKVTAYHGHDENVEIPWMIDGMSVRCIGEGAFKGRSFIRSVEIPLLVTAIDKEAFCDCGQLYQARIPGGVQYIGPRAFCGCGSLEDTRIPTSVTKIEQDAFRDCASLTLVTDEFSDAETYARRNGLRYRRPLMYMHACE